MTSVCEAGVLFTPQRHLPSGAISAGRKLQSACGRTHSINVLIWRNSDRRASLLAQTGKSLPAVQETQVRSLGREDPLEKGMAPHSSVLAWRIPWTEALVGHSQWGHRVGHD